MSRAGTSRLIAASPEKVWELVGDFGRWDVWLPRIKSSTLEGGRGRAPVGAVRALVLDNGSQVGERLMAYDERRRTLVYSFTVPPPFAVSHYEATVEVHAVGRGESTLVVWGGEFDPAGESAATLSLRLNLGARRADGFRGVVGCECSG